MLPNGVSLSEHSHIPDFMEIEEAAKSGRGSSVLDSIATLNSTETQAGFSEACPEPFGYVVKTYR